MHDNEFLSPTGEIKLTDKELFESPELQKMAEEVRWENIQAPGSDTAGPGIGSSNLTEQMFLD